jgi:chaperonin GroEL
MVNDKVGDGTTTVAVLSGALLEHGRRVVAAGMDPMQVAAGMRAASRIAVESVLGAAHAVRTQTDLERVALIASNRDEEIAAHLAEACMAVGRDGTIVIEDGKGVQSVLTFKEGMEINQGALSPRFLGSSSERVIEGPLVAVVDSILSRADDVREMMEVASQWPQNQLLVFALDVTGEALNTMTLNDSKGVVRCVAVRAPGGAQRSEHLKDIAALAGADFVESLTGYDIKAWDASWFGSLRQATIREKSCVLAAYGESTETVENRLAEIRAAEQHCTSDYDRDRLRERKAKLTGGMAIIEVGGVTEAAMKERRARVEDALSAVQAALESGVVPGGGVAYLAASTTVLNAKDPDKSEDFKAGWDAFGWALRRPLEVLARNAGRTGRTIVEQVLSAQEGSVNMGWDAVTDEIRDLTLDPPVIDPAKVTVTVMEAACSVASTLLTSGASITLGGDR